MINEIYKECARVYFNRHTIEEYKQAHANFKQKEQLVLQALNKLTVKKLINVCANLGIYVHDKKKANVVSKVFDGLESFFLLGRGVSYSPFDGQTYRGQFDKIIEKTDSDFLDHFYTKREEDLKSKSKALENPETLEEFNTFIAHNGEGKLTDEQKVRIDFLKAEVLIKRRERQEEQNKTVKAIETPDNLELSIHETKHSKTGAEIFTVVMNTRISKEEYKELNLASKKLGGYYSRYSDASANPPIKPGFNFNNRDNAQSFVNLSQGDQKRSEEGKEVSQVDNLMKKGIDLVTKGEEKKHQTEGSQTNTHKRATQAMHSMADAKDKIKKGKILINLAKGIESGSIKYLTRIRNVVELDQLFQILKAGQGERTKEMSYSEREKITVLCEDDVLFVKPVKITYHINFLKQVVADHEQDAGLKLDCARLQKALNRVKDDEWSFEAQGTTLETIKKIASKISNTPSNERTIERLNYPLKEFNRIERLGLTTGFMLRMALRELLKFINEAGPTPEEKAKEEIRRMEQKVQFVKIEGFYPTPDELIEKMLSMAKVFEGERICEPSAGKGDIAEAVKSKYPDNKLTVIELNTSLSEILRAKRI